MICEHGSDIMAFWFAYSHKNFSEEKGKIKIGI